jgi:hypothetical protein
MAVSRPRDRRILQGLDWPLNPVVFAQPDEKENLVKDAARISTAEAIGKCSVKNVRSGMRKPKTGSAKPDFPEINQTVTD